MRSDTKWNGDFDRRRVLRNPQSVSAAAEALKGPLIVRMLLCAWLGELKTYFGSLCEQAGYLG